jgi:hypothetical protein
MRPRPVLSIFVAVALSFAAASCDFSPTSPFSGFGGEEGATLNGQFRQSGGTARAQLTAGSTYHAQTAPAAASEAEPVRVIVLEAAKLDGAKNEIASVDIVNGSFTPNQEIDIVVSMVDGKVVLLEERRTGIDHEGASGIELEGAATNIVIDSPGDPMTGSLDVNGYHILTRAAETSIRKGNRSLTLKDLDPGDQVHVRGVFEGDDVFAFEIKLQEEEEDDEEDISPSEACDYVDPNHPGKILICHKGKKTLSVSPSAWPAHAAHRDGCGPC